MEGDVEVVEDPAWLEEGTEQGDGVPPPWLPVIQSGQAGGHQGACNNTSLNGIPS